MIKLTITEKLWDGVRPSSVKKTGLSEAIRGVVAIPKNLAALPTPKAFDDVAAAITALQAAIGKAEAEVAKGNDDKKGAAAKLKAWHAEAGSALDEVALQRKQAGLVKAAVDADGRMKELDKEVDDAIRDCIAMKADLTKKLRNREAIDIKKCQQDLQTCMTALRDAAKASQKDGFADYIRTRPSVLAWGINPAEVPLPPAAKVMKGKLATLEAEVKLVRLMVEAALQEDARGRTGTAADVAKPLVADYQDLSRFLKGQVAKAKALVGVAHKLAEQIKAGTEPDVAKSLALVKTVHNKLIDLDDQSTGQLARGRKASGDIMTKRAQLRDSLGKGTNEFKEFETIAGKEWNMVMAVYRDVSQPIGDASRQIDRALRLLIDAGGMGQAPAKALLATVEKDRNEIRSRYG